MTYDVHMLPNMIVTLTDSSSLVELLIAYNQVQLRQ